jgi:hypothetical protein
VYERLLKPLDAAVPNPDDSDAVLQKFVQTYCREGIIRLYFPNAKFDEVERAWKALEGNEHSSDESKHHPDAIFAQAPTVKVKERLKVVYEKAKLLPPREEIEIVASKKGLLDSLRDWFDDSCRLARVVNQVAKKIPEQRRGGREVAGANAVAILEDEVVKHLKDLPRPMTGEYERWFTQEFKWEAGKPFPWDKPTEKRYRDVALLFTEKKSFSDQQKNAAREMKRLLDSWDVPGIEKADIEERPWFIGRCFVEFLSLKHLGLTKEEREQLNMENSFVWQCLKKLPEGGWSNSTSSSKEPWDKVRERLSELAEKFKKSDRPNGGLDADLVRFVRKAISNWDAERDTLKKKEQEISQRKAQLRKNIDIIEEELKRLRQGDETVRSEDKKLLNELVKLPIDKRDEHLKALEQRREWFANINAEIKAKKAEKKKLEEELKGLEQEAKQPQIYSSVKKEVNELWNRLVHGATQTPQSRDK